VIAGLGGEFCSCAARDLAVNSADLAIAHRRHGWIATVRLLTDAYIQRQGSEQIDTVLPGQEIATTFTEYMFAMTTVAAYMNAHILDHAEYRYFDFFKHLQTLARIQQGYILRRSNDDGATHRDTLRQG
jgi:hypothetical protein